MSVEMSVDDLIKVCIILDRVIEERRAEEARYLDKKLGKEFSEVEAFVAAWTDYNIEDLCELRNRLFNQIPPDRL
jgi:hypothetical protein